MKSFFSRDDVTAARKAGQNLYFVAHRTIGETRREDCELTRSKPMVETTDAGLVHAALLYLIKRDAPARARLKEVVNAL